MAEVRKVIVEIRDTNKVKEKEIIKKVNGRNVVDMQKAVSKNYTSIDAEILSSSALVKEVVGQVKQDILQAIDLTSSRYFNLKEDYINNARYNNFLRGADLVISMGNSIMGGATMGFAFAGPVGAVAGAVATGVASGIGKAVEYQGRISEYYQSLNASNYQLNFARTRAGLSNGLKGTEN